MWVKFVVGSLPCSEGLSPGSSVFLPPQKPTFPNLIWNFYSNLNTPVLTLSLPESVMDTFKVVLILSLWMKS